jgi:hypothetical protein
VGGWVSEWVQQQLGTGAVKTTEASIWYNADRLGVSWPLHRHCICTKWFSAHTDELNLCLLLGVSARLTSRPAQC